MFFLFCLQSELDRFIKENPSFDLNEKSMYVVVGKTEMRLKKR